MRKTLTYTDISKRALEEFRLLEQKNPKTPKPYLVLEVIEMLKTINWQRKYPEIPAATEIRTMIEEKIKKVSNF